MGLLLRLLGYSGATGLECGPCFLYPTHLFLSLQRAPAPSVALYKHALGNGVEIAREDPGAGLLREELTCGFTYH